MKHKVFIFLLFCLYSSVTFAYAFTEEFDENWQQRWTSSKDAKYKGSFKVESLEPDYGLYIPQKAMHYGLTALLEETFDPADGVILQFEAKWSKQQTCSGAYLKFFSHDAIFKAEDMKEDTAYTVMFGPDKCGSTSKVHFILNHRSPKSGKLEEKHLENPAKVPADKKSHVYTAIIKPDNSLEIMLDDVVVVEGTLLENFKPPINPPKEIADPEDKKPEDWVDLAKIDDPDAVKPEDWVDERMIDDMDAKKPDGWLDDELPEIVDVSAEKPEDWDEEEDGEWIAPLIKNPKCDQAPGCGEWKRPQKPNPEYKGPWKAPKIDNPEYKGEWKQKQIPNPDYFVNDAPLKNLAPIGSIGLELWTMDEGIFFDNIIVTKDADLAKKYREKWETRYQLEEGQEKEKVEQKQKEIQEKSGAAGTLQKFIDDPRLAAIKPHIQPIVTFAEANAPGFYIFLAVVGGLLFSTIMRYLRKSTTKVKVGQDKKEDVTGPDDEPPASTGAGQSSSTSKNGAEDETKKEEEDEDEDEQQKDKTTSKRTRRAD